VTRPSKVGEILLIAFGLVFAFAGIFFAVKIFSGAFGAPDQPQQNLWVGVLVSTIFILVGGGIVYGTVAGTRKLEEQAAAEQSNPESPWLWRKDWAVSRAESKNRNSTISLWTLAIFWNTIVFTVAFSVTPKLRQTSNLVILVPLSFCVIGLVLAGMAIRASIRRKRFGETYFEFASLPFCPGKSLKGTIHLRFNAEARHGIDLRLRCVRQVVTGSGKNRSIQESVLWQGDKNVPQEMVMPGPMGDAAIPVEFSIPSDAYESCEDQPDDKVLWLLHAQADVPGVNYWDDFEVPVFRLTQSPVSDSVSTSSFSAPMGAAPAFQFDASDVSAPPNPRVVVTTGVNNGTEFYFPPFRNPGQVLLLSVFTAIWTGIVYFLMHSHAPRFFAAVFGFFDIFLIYGLMRAAMGSFHVEIGNGKIIFRRTLLGMGAAREIPFSEIAQILPEEIAQQKGARPSYSLCLSTRAGKKLTLADAIDNRQEARWVAAQLEKLAGLKLDTHVATGGGFGLNGPPPQRGNVRSGSLPNFRRNSPAAVALGLAFFLAWTGFVFYNVLSHGHRQPRRILRSAAAARTPLRQAAYSPLTDDDVQRLQTLPDQAQAEELLERAIQHDPRALEMFEQNIGVWRNLQRSTRMNDLERRSCFSTDLRVRYANADLNLAIDGVSKTEQSADQLIAQAQADPAHRPFSVYHMGMLAGRGVAYDRIYPILVDYARNDNDPHVRQWAVEGMRYLGTDDALAELFASFTHDSSDEVRNRAGCNVSDCGNFMRKQRLQMVPKLIETAADPQISPQMRSWTFLALHEITDQNLPADAPAWRDWYTQYGAEKMDEFQRQDWWRVRGDQ
jgi:HEAT repeats